VIAAFSQRPLLLPLCSFAGGIVSAGVFGLSLPGYLFPVSLVLALAVVFLRSAPPFAIAMGLMFFVAGNLLPQPALRGDPAERALLERHAGEVLLVEGRVVRRPETRDNGSRVLIRPVHVFSGRTGLSLRGDIMLRVEEGRVDLLSGDLVRFSGRLRAPRNFGIPGEFDAERHFAMQGIVATSYAKNMDGVVLIRRGGDSLQRRFDAMADRIGTFIMASVPAVEGGILKALVVGDSSDIPGEVRDAYSRTGVNHILSISGFHVGIIALVLFQAWYALSRLFPPLLLHFNLRRLAPVLSLPLIFSYMFVSGASPATARSVLMLLCLMVGMVLEREFDHFNSLVLAAFVLLLANPANLFDISCQLSFLALWGLMVLTPLLVPLFRVEEGGAAYRLVRFFAASLAAVAVTLLPVAYYFQQSTLTGLLSNFFIVPLLGYGAVVLGFASLPLIWLFPAGAGWLLGCAALLVGLSNRIIAWLDRLPLLPDFNVTRIDLVLLLAAMLLLTILSGCRRKLGVLTGMPLMLISLHLVPIPSGEKVVRLDFLSVGQGESTLVTFADGSRMLIDGGGALHDNGWDPGRRLLIPCLRRMGVKRIDYLVLSHPHPDHLQGLRAVAETLPVGEFWETGVAGGGDDYHALKRVLAQRHVPVRRLDANTPPFRIPGAAITIFSPDPGMLAVTSPPDLNETSLVMRIDAGRFSALFTGDIGTATESLLLRHPANLRATVLKVPHHGSRHSALPEFFRAVSPQVALIGAGYRNGFGLPSAVVLDELSRTAGLICRTDLDGTVTVETSNDGENLVISSVKRHFN